MFKCLQDYGGQGNNLNGTLDDLVLALPYRPVDISYFRKFDCLFE